MIAGRKYIKLQPHTTLHNLGRTAITKYQITNPKLQINLKPQYSMTEALRALQHQTQGTK